MNKRIDYQTLDREFAYSGELGAVYTPDRTTFRVWSPSAENVTLNLYRDSVDSKAYSEVEMTYIDGVWSADVDGDLHGVYYTYTITANGGSVETIDIYARSAGANGVRGMVIDMSRTDPEGWENSDYVTLEDYTDAVLYELHIRDFSADASGGFKYRGKFKAFCESGIVNENGDVIGLDYIKGLGVTHIHLLPVADYETVDETSCEPQFNWGYDPQNYNLPEGSYSTEPADGSRRVREFKELILAAHERGLGIVMDVVYNHTFSTLDSSFNKTVPGYYYRHNNDGSFSDGSACGNDFASERAMARKFICDSLCMWAQEYKIDGFRFDLMGLLDIETMNVCADKLRRINPSVILYGEGWTANSCPLDEKHRAMKKNAILVPEIAMFSDDFRDGLKGSVFIDEECGYINGNANLETAELMKSLLCGGIRHASSKRDDTEIWTDRPQQVINYVEAHDNLTLYDKLRISSPKSTTKEILAMDKLAAALIFLSQGVPFFQAGQEMLRTKTDADGNFVHDSYKSPDSINSLKWNDVTNNADIVAYYRGLIAVRRRFSQFRLRTAAEIREKISFTDLENGAFAMRLDGFILLVNPTAETISRKIDGNAKIYVDGNIASSEPFKSVDGVLTAEPISVTLAERV